MHRNGRPIMCGAPTWTCSNDGCPAFRTIYIVGPDLPKHPPCWCKSGISRWVAGGSNLPKGQVDFLVRERDDNVLRLFGAYDLDLVTLRSGA